MPAEKKAKKRRKAKIRKKARKPVSRPRRQWARWPNERLLDLRLCDLGLSIKGTWLERPINALYGELEEAGVRVRPHLWLSEEWFCPEGVPGIAIPFYLAHPRLMRLERSQLLEVEGGTHRKCLKILRHETGHTIQHAYELHRRKSWQNVFGRSSAPYPDYYRPNPASKRYVLHLDLWYAQSHPDEDFAETFAIWLTPGSQWRKRYRGWPALKKLEYVDRLMKDLAKEKRKVATQRTLDPLSRIEKTLRAYYAERRERCMPAHSQAFDQDLRRLFVDGSQGEPAAVFLRRHRGEIRRLVARWTGEYQFTLDAVLQDMIGRCGELKLRAVGPERELKLDFAILLTVKAMQYLYRGREWHPL